MNKRELRWTEYAARLFCVAFAAALLYLALKYAGGLLVTSLLAILTSLLISPIAEGLSRLTKIKRRLSAAICVLTLFVLFGGALLFSVSRLTREIQELLALFSQSRDGIYLSFMGLLEEIESSLSSLPLVKGGTVVGGYIEGILSSALNNILNFTGQRIGAALGGLLRSTPKGAMLLLFYLVSTFYLTVDSQGISSLCARFLPSAACKWANDLKKRLISAAGQYARAYLLIFVITFGEVLLGLSILGLPYPLLMALITAAVDILPVFGSGAVLIPWAILSLLASEYKTGLGLLVLYGAITLVRQIAEPHIVGERLGIHPLISFSLMIGGGYLFGIGGAVAAPFVAIVVKEILSHKSKTM